MRKFMVLILLLAALLGTLNSVMAQSSTLVVWADTTRAPVILGLVDQVSADLGVTLEVVEVGFGDIRDQLLVAGPVGEGPDILIGAHDWLGQLVSNGAVAPIDLSAVAENFLPFTLAAFQYDGVQYGLPYAFENIALVRNVDLVPTAPATWQEVRTIAEAFKADGGPWAFAVQSGDAYHHYPILTSFGGYTFGLNENGSYNPSDVGFATEGGLAAAEWLGGMYADELMPIVGGNEILPLFENGELAMYMTGPWASGDLTASGINYSIDALPGSEGGLANGVPFSGVQGFMISGYSDNALVAELFLTQYVATLDVQQALFDAGLRPSAFIGVDTSADPNAAGFIAAGVNAVPMPAIPEMGATWTAAGNAYTLVAQGEDPVTTFTNAQQQIVDAISASQAMAAQGRVFGVPGSYQAAAGCAGDWDPACEVTLMSDEDGDGVYTLTVTLPAGSYEYKVAVNGSWDENYGANGESGGANLTLVLDAETEVTFSYSDETKIITDSVNNP